MDRTAETTEERPAGRKWRSPLLLRALSAVTVWALAVIGLAQLWQWGFGFPTGDAWALAIGPMTMIGMLILLMVIVIGALRREEQTAP
ncbi:MAG: hypothetical protein ACRDJE_00240 [Dehalococcoidia bacterium]